jgi:hypothetical protein
MEAHPIYLAFDPYVIWFYRITGYTFLDFLLGTFVLACASVLIGELACRLALRMVSRYVDEDAGELVRLQGLSVAALVAKDMPAYRACNKLATDAYGKVFFLGISLAAGAAWPIFFALTWMGYRFQGVEFDFAFTGWMVSYPCVFLALYAAAYLLFRKFKYHLP